MSLHKISSLDQITCFKGDAGNKRPNIFQYSNDFSPNTQSSITSLVLSHPHSYSKLRSYFPNFLNLGNNVTKL